MLSKDAAYYFNNVIMVVFAVLLTYLTVSSALPAFLPFGGQTVSAGTYNAIARPLGVIYLAILAVCPLLSWGRTEGKQFWKRARIPGICAVVLFAVLMFYFVTYLLPSYDAILAAGGTEAEMCIRDRDQTRCLARLRLRIRYGHGAGCMCAPVYRRRYGAEGR